MRGLGFRAPHPNICRGRNAYHYFFVGFRKTNRLQYQAEADLTCSGLYISPTGIFLIFGGNVFGLPLLGPVVPLLG